MNFSNEHIGGGADGGILNLYVDLPEWMEHEGISGALSAIDTAVKAIKTPPVAEVFNDSVDPDRESAEEYRKFYVQFNPEATAEDIKAAVDIVAGAIQKLRYS